MLAVAGRIIAWRGATPDVAETVYLGVLAGALSLVFAQGQRFLASSAGTNPWVEIGRTMGLTAFAIRMFRPYLSPVFFGGMDATSYAYGMSDALAQVRAGIFPVFVGQSEFMFEGVIHPIRTAPYHHYLGILLDALTGRSLEPVAIEHLTIVITAVLGALMAYVCLAGLAPRRRWTAWFAAMIYVGAPALAGFIYTEEMYMTFMAFGWLPLVLYANVRLIRADDWRDGKLLAAGLTVLWLCHPPVGLWATLLSGLLQGTRLALAGSRRSLLRAGAAILLFAGLSLYYFWSMAEIAAGNPASVVARGANPLVFATLGGGFAFLMRYLAGGSRIWFRIAVAVAIGLGFFFRLYGLWLGAAALATAIWGAVSARLPGWAWRQRLPEIGFGLFLAAGICILPWCAPADAIPAMALIERLFPQNISPLSAGANLPSDVQLGYPVLVFGLIGIVAAIRSGPKEIKLLAISALIGLAFVIPIPGLTRLFLAMLPDFVVTVSSVSLWQRDLPVLLALVVFLGFLGIEFLGERGRWVRGALILVAAGGACWTAGESEKFVRSGYRAMHSTGEHRDLNRPENVRQFAYIFSNLPVSPYLLNGVADYHLESRLLRADGSGGELTETVPWPNPAWQPLTFVTDELNSRFLNLSPSFTLAPGEHRLLKFRFFDRPYNGVLVMRGPRGWYREYLFPAAGFGLKSFGVDPDRPKTLAIWNSSREPQPVEMVFILNEIPVAPYPPGVFAQLATIPYDPEHLPIRTLGLIPYRAEVSTAGTAFLETPRMFIPGYRATVNGRPRVVERSPNERAMIKLEPGENRVEVRYAGTRVLWAALTVSAIAWLGLFASLLRKHPRMSDANLSAKTGPN